MLISLPQSIHLQLPMLIHQIGVNSSSFLAHLESFSIVSWNARALAHHSANKFRLKREVFEKQIFKYDVVCIQEAHGDAKNAFNQFVSASFPAARPLAGHLRDARAVGLAAALSIGRCSSSCSC